MCQISPKRILYTPPRGIGDIMFSMPLMHSIKQAFPMAEIFVPIPRDKQEALALTGLAKQTPKYLPKPSEDPLADARWRASIAGDRTEKYRLEKLIYEKYLAGEKFDLAIIPKNFVIDSINCPMSLSENEVRKVGLDNGNCHMVERFLRFTDLLGIERKVCFDLAINRDDKARYSSGEEAKIEKPYVVLNLGASVGKKFWNAIGYSEVASWCLDNSREVVLIGGSDCFDIASSIKRAESRVTNTVLKGSYSFDLRNIALLCSRAEALLSPDTGVLHIADAVGTKSIGLYGPTSPEKYAPFNNQDLVVSRYNIDKSVQKISSREVIKKLREAIII